MVKIISGQEGPETNELEMNKNFISKKPLLKIAFLRHLVYEILQIVQGYRTYSNTIKIKSKIGKMFPVCASMRLYP